MMISIVTIIIGGNTTAITANEQLHKQIKGCASSILEIKCNSSARADRFQALPVGAISASEPRTSLAGGAAHLADPLARPRGRERDPSP